MSIQVFTVASLEAKEGKLEELKQILVGLAEKTRQEKGNIEYLIIEDPSKPHSLFSIEKWENEEAESKHWKTPHLKDTLAKAEGLLAGEPTMHINKGNLLF
ncbi:putative quinol monooxygenase [Microscilla marina]|uniref:Antibiotic biosynthesis monooxygenase n=1 Tax=Microscilla marina ATCC 23134 TaxID=313606 RepID=A1ZQK7_MICM2|nr:putative quinol monooxygenase [Microscilla marina]EAY27379.1 antibiotic biosynthesis monooxygenase [Microscilla marina ATCC 23134]